MEQIYHGSNSRGFTITGLEIDQRTLGEAMYTYSKMRDAEEEKKAAEADYQKFAQYFEINPRTKEAVEMRRSKVERTLMQARSEYGKAAREAEPLLRELASPPPVVPAVDEEMIRQLVEREIRERKLVTLRIFDEELDKWERKLENLWMKDIRRGTEGFALRSEQDRLWMQVNNLGSRQRQNSVPSDGSRDVDQRILSHSREMDHIRAEIAAKARQHREDIASLEKSVSALQAQTNDKSSSSVQMGPGATLGDLLKVYPTLSTLTIRLKQHWERHKRWLMISTSQYMTCNFN